jgi:hypothetical protein
MGAIGCALAAAAGAQQIVNVTADIGVSTTWTANNVYNLTQQIYVLPGASLTIQAGTVVASQNGGSLAVTRGAQLFVQGTELAPVIMTSDDDRATWTNGDPRTGTWREASNDWGNLTLMGRAYISENIPAGVNTPTPNPNNVATMEGLVAAFPGDTRVLYGGGDDDDDSGSISYLSIRYGGLVVGLNVELNGLALGGIGRNTDIHHVEVMNGVDDGVEIWGGTVNLKYLSIWNVGDDSVDLDQGWRGTMQYGLIVQGYSNNAAQGSGVGDNCFETDGAEQSDYQPVTTGVIYNFTVIGQPIDGDHGTAWRDNCRLQYRNCIFMDLGERLVSFDNIDGDGGAGYGFGGTLSWPATWTTPYNVTSPINPFPNNPASYYTAQFSGNLAEIKDSVFFNNNFATAYTEANARGVNNPACNNVVATALPIQALTRDLPGVVRGGKVMQRVLFLDPRPANDALSSVAWAPTNGVLTSAHYRGGFAPGANWLEGWTASDAFGFTPGDGWCDVGEARGGLTGDPVLSGTGTYGPGPISLSLSNAAPFSLAVIALGVGRLDLPAFGGVVVPNYFTLGAFVQFTDGAGQSSFNLNIPAPFPSGTPFYHQYGVLDSAAAQGVAFSNAVLKVSP